jgi:hypothetical protein
MGFINSRTYSYGFSSTLCHHIAFDCGKIELALLRMDGTFRVYCIHSETKRSLAPCSLTVVMRLASIQSYYKVCIAAYTSRREKQNT